MTFKKLPMWRDENPISYEKQQISNRLRKLRWNQDADPGEIKELKARYAELERKRLEMKNSQY